LSTRDAVPSVATRRISALSRSATSAEPSGRNAMPHGISSRPATVRATVTSGTVVGYSAGVAGADDATLDEGGTVGGRSAGSSSPHAASSGTRRAVASSVVTTVT
jgi:hypothetical protein